MGGVAGIFQSVVQYVHDDVVPIGPGGVVGWYSKESQTYVQQMLRLYRFAIKYEMEDLADRTIDEIQAHEHRCNGSLRVGWIQEVYQTSEPGSKMRLHFAASLYHPGITMKMGAPRCVRTPQFKTIIRGPFPEAVDDIYRIGKVFERQSESIEGQVDHRDQNAFGTCVFHLHPEGEICHALNPQVLEARSFRNDWGDWDESLTNLRAPIVYPVDYGSDTEDDDDIANEKLDPGTDANDGQATFDTTGKHTSPDFEDSGLSVEDEEMDRGASAHPSTKPSSSVNVRTDESRKRKRSQTTSPMKYEQSTPANPWDVSLPPKNQAEIHRLNQFLAQCAERGLDGYIFGLTEEEKKALIAQSKPKPARADTHKKTKMHTTSNLPTPTPKPALKVVQPPVKSVKPVPDDTDIFTCKACDEQFLRKKDFLDHLARKKSDRNHRMGGRSFSPLVWTPVVFWYHSGKG